MLPVYTAGSVLLGVFSSVWTCMWPCSAQHWAAVKKSQLGTSHILTGHPCLKFSLSVNRVTGRNSVQGWRTSLFGKRRFFHLANAWEFSGVSGMTQAAFPRGKMLLGGHPPLHPSSHRAGHLLRGAMFLCPLAPGSITWESCHSHGQHLWAAAGYGGKKLFLRLCPSLCFFCLPLPWL